MCIRDRFQGETLEELAKNTGMDPERFAANIEAYNAACASKADPFGKSAENLVYPVSDGPFYAVKTVSYTHLKARKDFGSRIGQDDEA